MEMNDRMQHALVIALISMILCRTSIILKRFMNYSMSIHRVYTAYASG